MFSGKQEPDAFRREGEVGQRPLAQAGANVRLSGQLQLADLSPLKEATRDFRAELERLSLLYNLLSYIHPGRGGGAPG